jgi:putative hydrolase of the HAD superfamily
MKQPKTIIFDADGMVINLPMFSEIFSKDYGIPLTEILPFFQNEFQACIVGQADTKKVILPYLKKWQWSEGVDKFFDYWFSTKHNLNHELIKEITKLSRGGVVCFLATNQDKYHSDYLKNNLHFNQIFDHVYTSSDISAKKPDPAFFSYIVKDGGVVPEKTLFFDDRPNYVQKAATYGFQAHQYQSIKRFNGTVTQFLKV